MKPKKHHHTVLSIYPTTAGLGFAVFRSPLDLDDWGTRRFHGKQKDEHCLGAVATLIDRHNPECIVLDDASGQQPPRSIRIRKLCRAIAALVRNRGIEVHLFSNKQVREYFRPAGATTKHRIAQVIANSIVALDHRVPRKRKPWQSESDVMGIFDAAALGITYFQSRGHDILPREDIAF